MKNADKSRSKVFSFINFGKHTKDNITNRMKQTIQKRPVIQKIRAKLFRDSENTMAMNTRNKLAGHMKRTNLVVFVAAGRAETALAAERNKFKITTVWTAIHGTAKRRVTTMNHLVDIFDDSRTRTEFINDMFIIIGKNGL